VAQGFVGKAILFAHESLVFPDGPWLTSLDMPAFADIPAVGERIEAGRPVFTLLVRGATMDECSDRLHQRVAEVERMLWPPRRSSIGG
jgi:predicted ATP-grasp superfamily ATP-dependent carboligase